MTFVGRRKPEGIGIAHQGGHPLQGKRGVGKKFPGGLHSDSGQFFTGAQVQVTVADFIKVVWGHMPGKGPGQFGEVPWARGVLPNRRENPVAAFGIAVKAARVGPEVALQGEAKQVHPMPQHVVSVGLSPFGLVEKGFENLFNLRQEAGTAEIKRGPRR
jgi:hypothetical protein